MKKIILLCLITTFAQSNSWANTNEAKGKHYMSLVAGSVRGLDYTAASAVGAFFNIDNIKTRLTIATTGNPTTNINAVIKGEYKFAFTNSKLQYNAYNGLGKWKKYGPQKDLRTIVSLYPKALLLVSAAETGAMRIEDMPGKKINLGELKTTQREMAIDALAIQDIDVIQDITSNALSDHNSERLLQASGMDAYFLESIHPMTEIATPGDRVIRLIDIPLTEKLQQEKPYYSFVKIPEDYYPNVFNPRDIFTFGINTNIVVSAKTSEEDVYLLTKSIFENISDIKDLQPEFSELSTETMLSGLSIPIHPGAMRYYKEAGLL